MAGVFGRPGAAVTDPLHSRAQFETELRQCNGRRTHPIAPAFLRIQPRETYMPAVSIALRARVCRTTLAIAILLGSLPLTAQAPTGRIVGRILDGATGQGLPDVGVQVVGTTLGVSSGIDGRYTLPDVPAGTVTIQVRRLGYRAEDRHRDRARRRDRRSSRTSPWRRDDHAHGAGRDRVSGAGLGERGARRAAHGDRRRQQHNDRADRAERRTAMPRRPYSG